MNNQNSKHVIMNRTIVNKSYKELNKSSPSNLISYIYSLKKELHEVKKEKLEQNWELQSLTKKFEELQSLTKKFEELESQIQKYLKDPKPITKEMGAMIDEILWLNKLP